MLPAGSPEGRFANRPYFFQAARRLGHGTALDILTAWSSGGRDGIGPTGSSLNDPGYQEPRRRNYRVRRWQGAAFHVGLIAGGVVVLAHGRASWKCRGHLGRVGLDRLGHSFACPAEMVPA